MMAQRHHRVAPKPVGFEFLQASYEVHDEKLYPEQQVVPAGHLLRRRRIVTRLQPLVHGPERKRDEILFVRRLSYDCVKMTLKLKLEIIVG